MRKCLYAAAAGLVILAGCDDRTSVPSEVLNKHSTTQAAATIKPSQFDPSAGPFKALPLKVIPFFADAPESWSIQSAHAGRIVLHCPLIPGSTEEVPDSGIDTLLSTRKAINAETYATLLAELKRATTEPSGVTTKVLTRDKLTIIERVEMFGLAGQPPAERLVGFNVKYLVQTDSLDYEVYELNVIDLSLEMYEKHGDLLRKVLRSLSYDPKATEQTP